jgi:hypothetical protein
MSASGLQASTKPVLRIIHVKDGWISETLKRTSNAQSYQLGTYESPVPLGQIFKASNGKTEVNRALEKGCLHHPMVTFVAEFVTEEEQQLPHGGPNELPDNVPVQVRHPNRAHVRRMCGRAHVRRMCDLAGSRGGSGGLPPSTQDSSRFRRRRTLLRGPLQLPCLPASGAKNTPSC